MAQKLELRASKLYLLIYAGVFVAFLMLIIIFFQFATKPRPSYYALSVDSEQKTSMQPLALPNVSTEALLSWASIAATSAYTLDFQNYATKLEELRDYFTVTGYKNYLAALDKEGKLDDIESQQLLVTAVVSGTPVVLSEGVVKDSMSWKLQLPLLVTYQGASEVPARQNLVVNMLVTQVPTKYASKGIGILQFVDREVGG